MKISELKRKLNELGPEWDDLDAVSPDQNDGSLYGLNDNITRKFCDKNGYRCDKEDNGAEMVAVL